MKKKKETYEGSLALEFMMTYGWAILVVLVGIGSLWYFGLFSENRYCNLNPEECVCEIYETLLSCDSDYISNCAELNTKECTQYRKLTPQELIEKSCNENPREDEDCKCVEYGYDFEDFVGYFFIDEIKLKEQLIDYQENKTYKINIAQCFRDGICYVNNTFPYDYAGKGRICINSNPKTEVEKLMDFSCKGLSNYFLKWDCELMHNLQSEQCSNVKTAWREKECRI